MGGDGRQHVQAYTAKQSAGVRGLDVDAILCEMQGRDLPLALNHAVRSQ